MLNSSLGIFFYVILPNHWVWRILSDEEKKTILNSSSDYNNIMYKKPQDYDREHCRSLSAIKTKEGQIIEYILDKYTPCSVLEVGPGNGFYTDMILNHASVKKYVGVDIVKPFIDYIDKNIAPRYRGSKEINLVCGDMLEYRSKEKYDLVIFVSSLHHIPNRLDFISKSKVLLKHGGGIVFIEPRHGLPRVAQLIKKYLRYYWKKSFWMNRKNLSTHHFLTMSEIKMMAKKCGLKLSDVGFFSYRGEKYFKQFFKTPLGFLSCVKFPLLPLFSQQVYARYETTEKICE